MKPIQVLGKPLPTHSPRDVEIGHVRKVRKHSSKRISKDITSGAPHPCVLALLILTPLVIGIVGSLIVLSASSNFRRLSGEAVGDVETTPISSTEPLDLNQAQDLVQDIHKMLASDDMLKGVGTNGEPIEKILKNWLELLNRIELKLRGTLTLREDKSGVIMDEEKRGDAHVLYFQQQHESDENTFIQKADEGLGEKEEGTSFGVL